MFYILVGSILSLAHVFELEHWCRKDDDFREEMKSEDTATTVIFWSIILIGWPVFWGMRLWWWIRYFWFEEDSGDEDHGS